MKDKSDNGETERGKWEKSGAPMKPKDAKEKYKKIKYVLFLMPLLQLNHLQQKRCPRNAFDAACATSPISPPGVSLRATRSRGSSTAAGRETKITAGKTRRGSGSVTTTSLTSSCGARTRPSGAKATARSGPRRRGTTTATRTAPTAETN